MQIQKTQNFTQRAVHIHPQESFCGVTPEGLCRTRHGHFSWNAGADRIKITDCGSNAM